MATPEHELPPAGRRELLRVFEEVSDLNRTLRFSFWPTVSSAPDPGADPPHRSSLLVPRKDGRLLHLWHRPPGVCGGLPREMLLWLHHHLTPHSCPRACHARVPGGRPKSLRSLTVGSSGQSQTPAYPSRECSPSV